MYDRTPPRGSDAYPVAGHGPAYEDADRVDLRELAQKIWHRRRLILGAVLIGAILAGIAVSQVTPLYTVVTKVMLDPRQVRIVTSKAVVSNLDVSEQVVNSEVAVLRSNVLMEKVVNDLGFKRLAILDSPRRTRSVSSMVRALFGLTNPDNAPAQSEKARHDRKMERLVFAIGKATTIQREGKSYVISIRVETADPKLSMLLAGDIARKYIASQLAGRRNSAQQTASWIEQRVGVLRADLEKAEAAVSDYRSTSLVLDGSSLKTASQQLVELNNRLALARADYTAVRAGYDQLVAVVAKKGILAATTIVTSPVLDRLNAQRVDLAHRDAVWGERYGADHPARKRLAREITQLDADIKREIQKLIDTKRNKVESARVLETSMAASIKDMEQRVIEISSNAIGLRELERKSEATRKSYQELLSRLAETRSQEQLQKADARIVERATIPGAPSSPRPKLMVTMGGAVGLALGLGLAFFLELSTTTFRNAAEIEQDTGLKVLAAIPRGNWKTPRAAFRDVDRNPTGIFAERMRHLRTAILRDTGANGDHGRSILLASSVPMEGKTTTTLALAEMAALAGKSVIVVDCDLRRSTMQKNFAWDMGSDLADFIHNECSLGDAIHSDSRLGFDVLASTDPLPSAADELSESWLEPMLTTLTKYYDLVLLDTPPVLAVSDALVLSQVVDSTLYVVRWDSTARAAVMKGLASLSEMGVQPAGIVLTMVDPNCEPMRYTEDYAYHA